MTTSQTSPILSEVLDGGKLSARTRAYFQDRLRNRIYNIVINELMAVQASNKQFTQAELAARIGKKPEQLSRWLSSPGNWTIDTISDLLLGISGSELELSINHIGEPQPCSSELSEIQKSNTHFI